MEPFLNNVVDRCTKRFVKLTGKNPCQCCGVVLGGVYFWTPGFLPRGAYKFMLLRLYRKSRFLFISHGKVLSGDIWNLSYGPNSLGQSDCKILLKCNISRKQREIKSSFCIQINIKISCKMVLFLLGLARHAQSCQNNKFAVSQQDIKKEAKDKFNFLHEDRHKVFYNLMSSFFVAIVRYPQSTQNNKFPICLQYLKEGRDEVDFLHADKQQILLQVDTINFIGYGPSCPNYLK